MRRLRRAHQKHAKEQAKRRKKFKQRAVAASTAAAITLAAGITLHKVLASYAPDPHELPVVQDTDKDLLADSEELALAYLPLEPDQNRNGILDGVELAKLSAADINELPWQQEAKPGQTYKWWAPQFGVERCDICGELIVMGPGGVVNPRLGISAEFPFLMALHYMEHHSFSYAAHYGHDPLRGRVDVVALLQALELRLPWQPNDHQLPVPHDADEDLLCDAEENELGYLPFDPDQNNNTILDGVELAKLSAVVIDQLPQINPGDPPPNEIHKIEHRARGNENCCICGLTVNMGSLEIVNPQRCLSVEFPILSEHYMTHGSFSYEGSTNSGRTNVPLLLRTLELRLPSEPNDHQLPVPDDEDEDLLANKEEQAIGYNPFDPDQNRNQILDGVELAKRCARVVDELPQYYPGPAPPPEGTYKKEHALDGTEKCHICGQEIHMGGWEIINPKLGLHYPDFNDPLDGTFLPDLALHYMREGSLDCYGRDHQGRVDVDRLLRVLELRFPYDPNDHQLPVDGDDLDGDLLTDNEELAAGYNLYDPDQNKNIIPDGIDIASQCAVAIDELPEHDPYSGDPPPKQTYKENYFQKGIEHCGVCPATVNMGYWLVVNPKLHLSIEVPVIVCHYAEHGSFSFSGDVHGKGRINVPLLIKILEMPRRCGDLGTLYLPGDWNKDCTENFKDFAKFARRWLESTDPNED